MVRLPLNWRWLLAITSLPSCALLLFYPFIPESPKRLCVKNRGSEAQNILQNIASSNQAKLPSGTLVLVLHDYYYVYEHEQENEHEHEREHSSSSNSNSKHAPLLSLLHNANNMDRPARLTSSFSMLFSSKLIRATLLLWILYFGNCFSYYGIVLLTSQL